MSDCFVFSLWIDIPRREQCEIDNGGILGFFRGEIEWAGCGVGLIAVKQRPGMTLRAVCLLDRVAKPFVDLQCFLPLLYPILVEIQRPIYITEPYQCCRGPIVIPLARLKLKGVNEVQTVWKG